MSESPPRLLSGVYRALIAVVLCMSGIEPIYADTILPIRNSPAQAQSEHTVVLILTDGARWDLTAGPAAPNLAKLGREGVLGEMIPVWPTISTPNHWALATGLYPIHGGPYDNSRFSPKNRRTIDEYHDPNWNGEPIWSAVARQGGISGVIGRWIGANYLATRPSFFIPYDDECLRCGDLVLQLLNQSSTTRPKLIALYSTIPDELEHKYGVGSSEVLKAIAQLDQMVGTLIKGVSRLDMKDKVDIIVVGDHGHRNINYDRPVYIDDYVAPSMLANSYDGAFEIWPKPGLENQVYERLVAANPHIHVFRNNNLPNRLHCCYGPFAPPIIMLPDPGWNICVRATGCPPLVGSHGFDNSLRDMHALFIAYGPDIKIGGRIEPFENVSVYSLLANILGLVPAKTDGSIRPFCRILVHVPRECIGAAH